MTASRPNLFAQGVDHRREDARLDLAPGQYADPLGQRIGWNLGLLPGIVGHDPVPLML